MKERANEVIKRVNLINANKKLPLKFLEVCKKVLCRAIVMNPKPFCDEPNSGLDPKTLYY